jgi:hypothetical protein
LPWQVAAAEDDLDGHTDSSNRVGTTSAVRPNADARDALRVQQLASAARVVVRDRLYWAL